MPRPGPIRQGKVPCILPLRASLRLHVLLTGENRLITPQIAINNRWSMVRGIYFSMISYIYMYCNVMELVRNASAKQQNLARQPFRVELHQCA